MTYEINCFFSCLFIAGCTSSNEIKVDIASQTIMSFGGNLKQVTIQPQDGEILAHYSLWIDSIDNTYSIPLIKLPTNGFVSITNSGGDRGPYTIYIKTDSQGRVVKQVEWDFVPDILMNRFIGH